MQRFFNILLVLAACGGPPYFWSDEYARTHPESADLVASSLTQGCPVEGATAGHLRKSFGRPEIVPTAKTTFAQWRFKLDDSSTLELSVQGDTVVQWDVAGRPSSRIAQPNYSWSLAQSEGFPRRVIRYLRAHPNTSSRTAFLMLRGCAAPGLPGPLLQAAWGPPSKIESSGDTTRWIYGFGVEGQHEIIILVSDTMRAFRSVHWNPSD